MPFGDQHHADGSQTGAVLRSVLGDDTGADETAVGVVDPVTLPGCEEEAPLVFLARPPPVLGQVGAGGEIAKRQTADRKSGERRSRHAGQAV
jgi:hypothetical protein